MQKAPAPAPPTTKPKTKKGKKSIKKPELKQESHLTFSQKLQKDLSSLTSDDYFKEISQKVDLTQLYKIKDTCFYNDQMNYTPILLEIIDHNLIEKYQGQKYLVQIWNKWSEMEFQKSLYDVPRVKAICYNYYIFIPSKGDKDSDCIHIVDCKDGCREVLIECDVNKDAICHITYNSTSETLILSTEKDLYYAKLSKRKIDGKEENEKGDDGLIRIRINDEDIERIEVGLKIQALLLNKIIETPPEAQQPVEQTVQPDQDTKQEQKKLQQTFVVFETTDHQLDFNHFIINEEKRTYQFIQVKELIPREKNSLKFIIDPIIKCDFIFVGKKKTNLSYAIRKSGYIDLYYDMTRTDSPNFEFEQIGMNFMAFYLKTKAVNGVDSKFYQIKTQDEKAEFSIAQQLGQNINFDDIIVQKVKNVKIFSSFQVQLVRDTTIVQVSHSYFVSTFDIVQKSWIKHEKYDKEVLYLFRTQRWNGKRWRMTLAAFLEKNNQIEIHYLDEIKGQENIIKIEGTSINLEYQDDFFYMVIENDDEVKIKVLFREKLYDLDIKDLPNNIELVKVENEEKKPIFMIQQNSDKIKAIYKLIVKNLNPDQAKEEEKYSEENSEEDSDSNSDYYHDYQGANEDAQEDEAVSFEEESYEVGEERFDTEGQQYREEKLEDQEESDEQEHDKEEQYEYRQKDEDQDKENEYEDRQKDEHSYKEEEFEDKQESEEFEDKQESEEQEEVDKDSDDEDEKEGGEEEEKEGEQKVNDQKQEPKKLEQKNQPQYSVTLDTICDFEKTEGNFKELDWCFYAATVKIEEDLFLFGRQDIFMINIKEETLKVFKDQNVVGIQLFSSSEVYAICGDSYNLPPGLRLYNLKRILKTNECKCIPIKRFDVGGQGDLEYSRQLNRVGFIISVTDLVLTPLLHRNTMRIFGMDELEDYFAYKIENDKMITLKPTAIQTWDIIGGKLIPNKKLPQQYDYTKFEVHSKYKNDRVIITQKQEKEKDKEKGKENDQVQKIKQDETQFYQTWQLQKNVKNQTPFILAKEKDIILWKLIRIDNKNNQYVVVEDFSFYHPKYKDEQRLFFSKNNKYMIEKLANGRMFLYEAQSQNTNSEVTVAWKINKKIEDFPEYLQIDPDVLNVYSPNFQFYIDVSRADENSFVIKDITDKIKCPIPPDIMEFNYEEEEKHEKQSIMSRFIWLDDNSFKIMSEDGVEKIIDFTDKVNIQQSNLVPLLTEAQWKGSLFYARQSKVKEGFTLQRLKAKYQQYLLSGGKMNLFTIDEHQFDLIDQSFTYLHWSIIEQLKNKMIKFKDLDDVVIKQLVFNILPGGNTILHYLSEDKDNYNHILEIFDIAHPTLEGQVQKKYYIPIIANAKGETVIHKLLTLKANKVINTILGYLKYYEIGHHSKLIQDIFPQFISKNLADLFPYINSRLIQIKEASTNVTTDEEEIGIFGVNNFVIKKDKNDESNIKCELLDIPCIYHQRHPKFQELFDTLGEVTDYQLFAQKPIQVLIDFNYPSVKQYTIKKLFVPYVLFLMTFTYFTSFVFHEISEKDKEYRIVLCLLGLYATYFFSNEIMQIFNNPIGYICSVWNYIDIIPVFGLYSLILFSFVSFGDYPNIVQKSTILSVTSFFMWFKLLYFLRLFKPTSYLILMIVEVIKDMRHFLLVLLIAILAFSNSFLIISLTNPENTINDKGEEESNGRFVETFADSITYTYRMVLGDFAVDEFGSNSLILVWGLFLLCTVFNMIVMLNLLIAIISESFAKVNSNSEMASYQVRAQIIAENNYLVPKYYQNNYALQGGFLAVNTDQDTEEKAAVDPVQEKLAQINKLIENQQKEILEIKNINDSNFKLIMKDLTIISKHFKNETDEKQDAKEKDDAQTKKETAKKKDEEDEL